MSVLGIVFSNIHDKESFEVTRKRTIASAPVGSRYRLIDFTLSNMVNSGISDIGIVVKNNYQSLMDHLSTGKEWDLARKNGGLTIIPPYGGYGESIYSTRLQAMKKILGFVEDNKAEYVVLCDCFNICNIDYKDVIKEHKENGADITCVYREHNVTFDDYMPIVTFDVDKSKRITKYDIKRNFFGPALVSTETWVMKRTLLIDLVKGAIKDELRSFNREILSKRVDSLKIYGYEFKGYFRSVGSMESYFDLNMDLLDLDVRNELFNQPSRSIYTKVRDSAPTKYHSGSKVDNSIIADGCDIQGTVINSVLFRGVTVAKGAVVKNSIIMQGTEVSENTHLEYVIADKEAKFVKEKEIVGTYGNLVYVKKREVM